MVESNVGVGRKRVEGPRLLRGEGAYVDDLRGEQPLHAVFVRSPHAHARVLEIAADGARALPGVVGVYTIDDIPSRMPPAPRVVPEALGEVALPLAADTVRVVGEAVAG